jgi:hypothetical protein
MSDQFEKRFPEHKKNIRRRHGRLIAEAIFWSSVLVGVTLLLLALPILAQTKIDKAPVCSGVAAIALVKTEIVFFPVYVPKKKVYTPINIFFALELLKPCKDAGRIRSQKDAKCYKQSRLP